MTRRGRRRAAPLLVWAVLLVAAGAASGWAGLGKAAVMIGATVVVAAVALLVFRTYIRRRALDFAWGWTWFETLVHAVHDDPSGAQAGHVLRVLERAEPAQIQQVVGLTQVAFGVRLRARLAAMGRNVDREDVIADVRRQAIAALGTHDDDPAWAEEADVILLRDLHTPLAQLDRDQRERLATFVPMFAAVMCEDPERDLPPLRAEVTRTLQAIRRRGAPAPSR